MLTLREAGIIQDKYHSERANLTVEQAALLFAVLEEPFPETHPKCLLNLIRAYIRRVEVEGATQQHPMLARDFNAEKLLYWAASIGWPKKSDYKDNLANLNGTPGSEHGDATGSTVCRKKADAVKGYRKLTPEAATLRELLYDAKWQESRTHKTLGESEAWRTWIIKFKERKDVKPLLKEIFYIKVDKKQVPIMARKLTPEQWEKVRKQEYRARYQQKKMKG